MIIFWVVLVSITGMGFPNYPQIEWNPRAYCSSGNYSSTVWKVELSTGGGKVEAIKCSVILGTKEAGEGKL